MATSSEGPGEQQAVSLLPNCERKGRPCGATEGRGLSPVTSLLPLPLRRRLAAFEEVEASIGPVMAPGEDTHAARPGDGGP